MKEVQMTITGIEHAENTFPINRENFARNGHLAIIGLGPGSRDMLAPRAMQALQVCDIVIGYRLYIEQIQDLLTDKDVHVSELTQEVERAK